MLNETHLFPGTIDDQDSTVKQATRHLRLQEALSQENREKAEIETILQGKS